MSSYGIITLPIVPLRAEPRHASEQESQLLFGELYEVLEENTEWISIKCHYDNYEGYIPSGQHNPVDSVYAEKYLEATHQLLSEENTIIGSTGELKLSIGSSLPFLDSENKVSLGAQSFHLKENISPLKEGNKRELIDVFSRKYLNTSYLWGGKSQFGIDCSGFSQTVFRVCGISLPLPRNASQQVLLGEEIELSKAKCGDLAFFTNPKGRVDHVGIMLNNHEIIHASHFVRIDDLDEKGILNRITGKYTHPLFKIKRYIQD
ncbi:C40 family peptidase [Sediminitomix flava]|uniref:NlpC/P60 family protein n=1 Tax=Sediminitomix flava TaxID=379075 RepID=A0A315Z507_SEDFL|nr:NlpC/P60 family protein [Sediminitomix flava]PWJ38502.1 NlpC/P60 family protein [Sediminitomix flava]